MSGGGGGYGRPAAAPKPQSAYQTSRPQTSSPQTRPQSAAPGGQPAPPSPFGNTSNWGQQNPLAAAAAPAGPDYMSQYQDSLGKSRAAISAQLQAAMSDINGNEQRAGTVISGLPAQYGAQYGAAQGSLQNAAATLDAHQQAGGGGSQTGYSKDWLAPEQQALTGTLTALQAQVPELQLAAQSEFANRRGQAQSIAGEQTSALDSSQRDAMMRSQEQQAGFAHDLQMEQMRQGASGGSPGSAQWWATQRSVNPQDTNALEGRAMSNGFVNDFSNWSPAKQSQYIGSGVPSPPMQSFLQYLAANNAATASKKAKPPGRR